MAANTFSWIPEFGAQKTIKPNVRVVKFGDGYETRQGVGLNTMPQVWAVSFTNRASAESAAIDAFLTAQGGVLPFLWQSPSDSAPQKYKCDSWNVSPVAYNLNTVSGTFTQVFEP